MPHGQISENNHNVGFVRGHYYKALKIYGGFLHPYSLCSLTFAEMYSEPFQTSNYCKKHKLRYLIGFWISIWIEKKSGFLEVSLRVFAMSQGMLWGPQRRIDNILWDISESYKNLFHLKLILVSGHEWAY